MNSGMIIALVAIIAPLITLIVIFDNIHEEKMRKMKIEAALREAEMQRGYAPGTYSRTFSSKKSYKEFEREMKKRKKKGQEPIFCSPEHDEASERAALEKGIEDLQKRIENLDVILNDKKRQKQDN